MTRLCFVFLLLIVVQMCLSARIIRSDGVVSNKKPTDADTTSEESEETFEKLTKDLEKVLSPEQNKEFHGVLTNLNNATTIQENLEGIVKLFAIGIAASVNSTEPYYKDSSTTLPSAPTAENTI